MAVPVTVSGARIEEVSLRDAQAFLVREGIAGYQPHDQDVAWGSFEDAGSLVGVGVLDASRPWQGRAWVVVAADRQHLGVGSELIALIAEMAQDRGLRYLRCPHHLARSLGLPVGRRVAAGLVQTVAVLPPPTEPPEERQKR